MGFDIKLVTPDVPNGDHYPVTVVRSKTRDRAVWMPYIEGDKPTPELKEAVAEFFEEGEVLYAEDWWHPLV